MTRSRARIAGSRGTAAFPARDARRAPDCRVIRVGHRRRIVPSHICVPQQLPLGFEAEPLVVAELDLQAGGGLPEERGARVERLREAAAAVPGMRQRRSPRPALHRGRLVDRHYRHRRWADGAPEGRRPAVSLAERHDARLVRDDGHAPAWRSGLRRPTTASAAPVSRS